MIQWSIDVLADAGCAPIVVAVPAAAIEEATEAVTGDSVLVVEGGASRQMSVAAALEHVPVDHVLVHDASRPLVTTDLVRRVLEGLGRAAAVIPALPIEETLKNVTEDRVVGTLPRAGVWRSQTPQGFDTAILKGAHGRAREDGLETTDDAQLIEHYGGEVMIVRGDRRNVKVTYPEDIDLAEAILQARP